MEGGALRRKGRALLSWRGTKLPVLDRAEGKEASARVSPFAPPPDRADLWIRNSSNCTLHTHTSQNAASTPILPCHCLSLKVALVCTIGSPCLHTYVRTPGQPCLAPVQWRSLTTCTGQAQEECEEGNPVLHHGVRSLGHW
jgi:hypothetical protein